MGPFDVAWLASSVRLATPLLFASTGELVSELSGILNIGLEGMVLNGAFFSFWGTHLTHSLVWGTLLGIASGLALATIMAFLSIHTRADQIVLGVALNILAAGTTTFAFRQLFSSGSTIVQVQRASSLALPGVSRIPLLGPTLFQQSPFGYLAFLGFGLTWLILSRTTWGLTIRAAGEVPAAADTAGLSVATVRWVGTLMAGAMAGLAGTVLSVGQVGLFTEGMSAGRGFLALAAVIFGGWKPIGVLGACLVFGAADALQLRLQAYPMVPAEVWLVATLFASVALLVQLGQRRTRLARVYGIVTTFVLWILSITLLVLRPSVQLPPQFWLMVPYILALLALAGLVRRVHMPAALAAPYRRGG